MLQGTKREENGEKEERLQLQRQEKMIAIVRQVHPRQYNKAIFCTFDVVAINCGHDYGRCKSTYTNLCFRCR